jgi:hypothetical protein
MSDKRPEKIIIASLEWRIDYNAKLGASVLGMCDAAKYLIQISKTPDIEDVRRATLLHEVLHAIWFTYGFKPTADEKHEVEEEIVSFVSSALFDVFACNPDLAAYISKKET